MKNNGGSAFPRTGFATHGQPERFDNEPEEGMSLRDWFAGMALGALRSQLITMLMAEDGDVSKAAEVAYRIADAMLAQRKLP